jgi:hypothetical protein
VSRFTSHLGLTLLEYSTGRAVTRNGLPLWYLSAAPLVWEIGALGSGVTIEVPTFDPAGWTDDRLRTIRLRGVTDLGSIPRLARWLIDPQGPEAKAYVLHDDGYVTQGWGGLYTRRQVDDMLIEAMKAVGAAWWKRQLVYAAVRVGGQIGWGA